MIEFTSNVVRYNGTGTTTSFDYTFRIFAPEDLLVYVDSVLQVYTADYDVTGVDLSEGGTVEFFVAPPSGTNNVVIVRSVPYTQTISIPEGSKFPVHLVETGMDRIVVMLHQLFDSSIRGISLAPFVTSGTENLEINQTAAERADRLIGFSPDGNSVVVGPTIAQITTLLDTSALGVINAPASTLRGRGSAGGAGTLQEITLGDGLTMNGTVLEAQAGFPSNDDHTRIEGHTVGLALEAGPVVDRENPDVARLDTCTYLVTDKGTIVTPRNGLTADFATVGAGGRDRADDGTSGHRWWKIFHIFKGTDVPELPTEDALLFSPADVLQQTAGFVNTGDSQSFIRQDSANERAGQSFTTTVALSQLHSVVVPIIRSGSPSGLIWLTIEADSSGSPSGTPLATSVKKSVGRLPASTAFVPFNFVGTNRIALSNATIYWIVARGDFTINGTAYAQWGRVTGGGYTGGEAKLFNGTSWSGSGADNRFSVIGLPTLNTVTMPSGYTEKCLLGFVQTIANGAELVACAGRDNAYIDRSLASGTGRVIANPVNTFANWFASGFGVTASALGAVPYKPSLNEQVRFYGTAASISFGVGGEDATDIPPAIPTTYIEDTEYYNSPASTVPTSTAEIPIGRSGGAFLTVTSASGSVAYRTGFTW